MSSSPTEGIGPPFITADITDELEALERYEASPDLLCDAINTFAVADIDRLPVRLVAAVVAWYRRTPTYADAVEDVRTGDRRLS